MTADQMTRWVLRVAAAIAMAVPLVSLAKTGGAGITMTAVVVMVALPLTIAALCLAALWLAPSARLAIAVTGMAAVSGVYLAEIYVASGFDKRQVAPYLRDLRQQSVPDAVAAMFPTDFLKRDGNNVVHAIVDAGGRPVQPLSGIPDRITVQCIEDGRDVLGWVREKHDRYGFNNPDSVWQQSRADIVFVGDSFTHSECVPRERGLVAATRNRFPLTVNLSASGNGPLSELGALTEYGVALRPKIAVWVFYENDVVDLGLEMSSPLLRGYLTPGYTQNLVGRRDEIRGLLEAFHERQFSEALAKWDEGGLHRFTTLAADLALLRHLRRRIDLPLTHEADQEKQPSFDDLATVLGAASERVAGWGGKLIFVYLPSYDGLIRRHRASLEIQTRVLDVARRLGLTAIDVSDVFARQPSPSILWQCERCHYTGAGFAIAGAEILRAIDAILTPS